MGRTVGRGARLLRALRDRRDARLLARASTEAAAALADESARVQAEVRAIAARLGPALDEARHAAPNVGRASGAAEERIEELLHRVGPLVAETARLAERTARMAGHTERRLSAGGRWAARAAAQRARRGDGPCRARPAIGAWSAVAGPLRRPRIRASGTARRVAEGSPAVLAPAGPGLGVVGLGLIGAQAAFVATFRGPRDRFWQRMTLTGLGLGGYALLARPALRRTRIGSLALLLGAASAAVLYRTFELGDHLARRILPSGSSDIADIYALRTLRPRGEIAVRLVFVIGPAEELFWRGLVQQGLMARFGRWRGTALATAAYGGAHAITGNLTLVGAAAVAGAHWSVLYAAGVPLGALVVSHQIWDVWIFLVQPTDRAPTTPRR